MTLLTVRDLRRKWKPHKDRLNELEPQHPTNIRFHRACSWLQQAEQLTDKADLDMALLNRWIAFNALYGQWDESAREPVADHACWRAFVDRILVLDGADCMAETLTENRRLVMAILDDEFLSRYFWQEPTDRRASKSRKAKYDARTWYLQGNWTLLLDRLIERIYLLRCQLVHGAATYNSSLNRTATRHCSMMLDHLLHAMLTIWVDNGVDEDWGAMCYPPLNGTMESPGSGRSAAKTRS